MIEALKERRLLKKLAAINGETVTRRFAFAKGAGARGTFQPYMSLRDWTSADFLSDPEKETPVFVRFSKALEQGGETGRDVRGFAVRFYTEEGNYDLLSLNLPVFCIGEPAKLPKLAEAVKRDRESNLRCPERFWAFAASNPESILMLLHLFGDGGTIKSYRHMPGYGVNTYRWKGRDGKRRLVRCSWRPMAGERTVTRQEAEFLAGFDSDAASRDLYETLKEGTPAEYELFVQMVPEESACDLPFCLTDASKIWPAQLIPPVRIGKMSLTDPVNDYLNEVEKAAFNPGNLVKGIEFSGDPLLAVMALAMEDGQRHRLGPDYESLPVNRSRSVPAQWDEDDETDDGTGRDAGVKKRSAGKNTGETHYLQAGAYYRGLGEEARRRLEDNVIDSMMFLRDDLQRELIRHFLQADQELGKQIAKGLAI
ncbi:catalase [Bacilliculturomica massiliensis]|uniref:catalase n=1 Tax=Bacilliculturomica massiliensis TaxID=1917867 RepID=UPI001031C14D|nr:catalase [Bacilliculturomica massiliensis]